jgi:hypothetical protein
MPHNRFYWGTTKLTWDLWGGSNANGAKVIHIGTCRGTATEHFRRTGGYLVGCRGPAAPADLEAVPREA